jgi:phytoene synthase
MESLDPHVVDVVRRQNRGRFVAAHFAPATERMGLIALLALQGELARVPATVSEPVLGQMRLQWWRDFVATVWDGGTPPAGHPVACAVARLRPQVEGAALRAMIDAQEEALAGADATTTAIAVARALAAAALAVLGVDDAPSRDAGVRAATAYELAVLARAGAAPAALVRLHLDAVRTLSAPDRRAVPLLLWATLAESLLVSRSGAVPVARLWWRAWRGRP